MATLEQELPTSVDILTSQVCTLDDPHSIAAELSLYLAPDITKESLFYLITPLEHIDSHIIGYWTSSIWLVIMTYFFRGNLWLPHRLLVSISSKGSLICTTDRTPQTTAFDEPVVNHWLALIFKSYLNPYLRDLKPVPWYCHNSFSEK